MRALVVYESMYGNTHLVAERVGAGPAGALEVCVRSVYGVDPVEVARADLFVVGGPTHVHGMSSARTREAAVDAADAHGAERVLEDGATEPGLREWFDWLGPLTGRSAAAFDTRVDMAALLTGRASRPIARRLEAHGMVLVAPPESFLVNRQTHLLDGELERAEAWGRLLSARVAALPV